MTRVHYYPILSEAPLRVSHHTLHFAALAQALGHRSETHPEHVPPLVWEIERIAAAFERSLCALRF